MPTRQIVRALLRCASALACLSALPALASAEFSVSAAQMQALGVQLQRLAQPAAIAGMAYPARVVLPPRQESVVSAPLAGLVDQLYVSENDAVRPGQPLLRLVSPELGELQLKLMEAASRSRLSQRTLQRERQLASEGLIPERRVQDAVAAAAEDQARLRQAEAALRLAGLDAESIRRAADDGVLQEALVLRARSAGVVLRLGAKPGQRVQPADALVHVADTSRLWLDIELPVARQSQSWGKDVRLEVVDRAATAAPQSLGATVSENQTLTLRAQVSSGAPLLRPGEMVQVRVPFPKGEAGWAVPLTALVRQGEQAFVFVRTDKGFVAQPVIVIDSAGQSLRVKGELRAGQEIAVSSVVALKSAWLGKGGSN